MVTNSIDTIKNFISYLRKSEEISNFLYKKAHTLYVNGQTQLLAQGADYYEFSVDDEFDDFRPKIKMGDTLSIECTCKGQNFCHHKIAALLQLQEELTNREPEKKNIGKEYTKQGMIKRVLEERRNKALTANYKIQLADNIFGEHILLNEKRKAYKITIRDFENQIGYCSCPDFQTNKLGTCKHLMYVFDYISKKDLFKKTTGQTYPFVEIYLDPLNNYRLSWHYPHELNPEIAELLHKIFGNETFLPDEKILDFFNFLNQAQTYKQILIRKDVIEKIERAFNRNILTEKSSKPDLDEIIQTQFHDINFFKYQIEGIKFAAFRDGAIIADEMGLGKTIQAVGVAIVKKHFFHFSKTLIVCPASLKDQWMREIEKFTYEKATIIEGYPKQRAEKYKSRDTYFHIINYETVIRDWQAINKGNYDLIILDEAQRIKNYETLTAQAIKSLRKKHALVITGTPIENRLADIYSIVDFVDNKFLSPLWEFSYQHCYFDLKIHNKITGYFNLIELKEKLKAILIRREKADVIDQLPNICQMDIPVIMSHQQRQYHSSYAHALAKILAKKFITPFDIQKIIMNLQKMRMVCDSTYLIDLETNHSPKLDELHDILFEKLDLQNNKRKILIFSEWKRMNNMIGKMLRNNKITYVELNGTVPVKNRGKIIREFEDNPECRVFISTEAGGSGLNLQVADTVINFELPWNPAKKNQRTGRIDRIGQTNQNLTVISLITKDSIEMKIASGLVLKQNLFDGVLNDSKTTSTVDFSAEGRAHFLKQLEEILSGLDGIDLSKPQEYEDTSEDSIFQNNLDKLGTELDLENFDKESSEKIDIIENKQDCISELEHVLENNHFEETNNQPANKSSKASKHEAQAEELENVMAQGLAFFSGLVKISTGKEMQMEGKGIEINRETGEVTMKFKLPF